MPNDRFRYNRPAARTPLLRRALARGGGFLLVGLAATLAVAWCLSAVVDLTAGTADSASAPTARGEWSVTRWNHTGGVFVASTIRKDSPSWTVEQLTGPPDTFQAGDYGTAWASASQDAQAEWLLLDYPAAVVPRRIVVHESYNPGAVIKVSVFREGSGDAAGGGGEEVTVYTAAPARTGNAGGVVVRDIPVNGVEFPIRRVKVYLDSVAVSGWNEIDAVGVVDETGMTHWAGGARASTAYNASTPRATDTGAPLPPPVGPMRLTPAWSGLRTPSEALVAGRIKHEYRAVAAWGWPMAAVWDDAPPPGMPGMPAPMSGTTVLLSGRSLMLSGARPAPTPTGPAPPTFRARRFPLRPVWTGLVVNTLFFAVSLGTLHWLATGMTRFLREAGRIRRGRCIACGYDLGYDFVPGCPECGWRREHGDAGGPQRMVDTASRTAGNGHGAADS